MTPRISILRALGTLDLTSTRIAEIVFGDSTKDRASTFRLLEMLARDGMVRADNTQHPTRWTRTVAGTAALMVFEGVGA